MIDPSAKSKGEPDCWYIYFDPKIPKEEYDHFVDIIQANYPAGCYRVIWNPYRYILDDMGGGKSAAHQKRRAAKNNDAEWVKSSVFRVAK